LPSLHVSAAVERRVLWLAMARVRSLHDPSCTAHPSAGGDGRRGGRLGQSEVASEVQSAGAFHACDSLSNVALMAVCCCSSTSRSIVSGETREWRESRLVEFVTRAHAWRRPTTLTVGRFAPCLPDLPLFLTALSLLSRSRGPSSHRPPSPTARAGACGTTRTPSFLSRCHPFPFCGAPVLARVPIATRRRDGRRDDETAMDAPISRMRMLPCFACHLSSAQRASARHHQCLAW